MTPSHSQHQLDTGETLEVRIRTPPIEIDREGIHYGWPNREALLDGELRSHSLDRFVIGEIDGERAGSMVLHVPADTKDVGIVGFVHTVEQHRRKGIGTLLLQTLIDLFRKDGGRALYLCTTNPAAHNLYRNCEFRPHVGDGMRWLAPGEDDFDNTFFSDAHGNASIREAHWGDLARCAALMNRPGHPGLIKHYQQNVYRDMRFEQHFVHLKQRTEDDKGSMFVLVAEGERVVGLCTLMERDRYPEQHIAILDVVVAPAYEHRGPDLLKYAIEDARKAGWWERIVSPTAGDQSPRANRLEKAGFTKREVLPEHFWTETGYQTLIWWTYALPTIDERRHPPAEYYGGRPSFLEE